MRLVFEISNYINEKKNKAIKTEIKELIDSKEKLGDKRKELKKILVNIVKNLVVFENIKFDILDYVKPNKRVVCYKSTSCTDEFHCKKVGSKCKLMVGKDNLITGKLNKET